MCLGQLYQYTHKERKKRNGRQVRKKSPYYGPLWPCQQTRVHYVFASAISVFTPREGEKKWRTGLKKSPHSDPVNKPPVSV